MKIVALLNKIAKENVKHNHSSTQFVIPKHIASDILNFSKGIHDNELYENDEEKYGREDEIHCTVLYGLTDETPENTFKELKKFNPFVVKLGKTSSFTTAKDYDVLKIEIISPELEKMHYYLEENLANENKFPEYKPHCTIAYLKKGEAEKYINDSRFEGMSFIINKIEFSSFNGEKVKMVI